MLPSLRLLSAAALTTSISALLALPAVAFTQAATPTCIDATNSRADGTEIRLRQCMDHNNQKFVIDAGHIKVKDTLT